MQTSSVSDSSSLYAQYAQNTSCKPCEVPRQQRHDDDDGGERSGRVGRSGGGERLIDAVFQALSQMGLGGPKPAETNVPQSTSPIGDVDVEVHIHYHYHQTTGSSGGSSSGSTSTATGGSTSTTGSTTNAGSTAGSGSTSGTSSSAGTGSTTESGTTSGSGSTSGTSSTSGTGSTTGTNSTSGTGSSSSTGSTSGTGSTTNSTTSPMSLISALGTFMHDLFSMLQGQGGVGESYGRARGHHHHHHHDGGGFSGIASNLQKLIQELTAAEKGSTQAATGADATSNATKPSALDTLQKDFKALVTAMGGDPEKASLKDFLLAFAQNLGGNTSTAGNLIQTTA